jgi:DNA-binding transcriptional ArsR family regulator
MPEMLDAQDMLEMEPRMSEAAKLMEMLSQPVRLRILCILLDGEQSVLKLADMAGLSQPAMSHHLRKLRDADLVNTRRDAQTIYYSLKGKEVGAVLEVLHGLYCKPPGRPPADRSLYRSKSAGSATPLPRLRSLQPLMAPACTGCRPVGALHLSGPRTSQTGFISPT